MGAPIVDLIAGAGEAVGNLAVKIREAITGKSVLNSEDQAKILSIANDLEKIQSDFAARALEAVNSTMQAEAKSEHWAQWLWRPSVGFTFAAILINNYILLPYFSKAGVVALPVPAEVWTAILVVLGAASAGRSWEKVTGNGKVK